MPHKTEHLKDEGSRSQVVASGAVAGLVSRFCIAPLDVVKIRLQLQINSFSDPLNSPLAVAIRRGTIATIRSIFREEGITAFWKGNIPAELLYVSYGAIQFSIYRGTTRLFHSLTTKRHLPDTAETFISGAVSGGVATTVTYPLDLLRTRFAAQGTQKVYSSLAASIRDITKDEGRKGFFRGLSAAITQIVPYMGLFFATYESLKIPFADLSLPIGSGDALAGISASVTAKSAVFPLDTIRKRLQVQGPTRTKYAHRNIPLYEGVRATLITIVQKEGFRGLYRGLPISLIKAAPASAITMWTYERTMQLLQASEQVTSGRS